MTGVEILAVKEVVAASAFCWPAFWVTLGVFLIGLTVLGLYLSHVEYLGTGIIIFCIIMGLIGGAIIGGMGGWLLAEPTEYETEYKVTIDDAVSMNEFLERYEIIDQEGKIYTVREKN